MTERDPPRNVDSYYSYIERAKRWPKNAPYPENPKCGSCEAYKVLTKRAHSTIGTCVVAALHPNPCANRYVLPSCLAHTYMSVYILTIHSRTHARTHARTHVRRHVACVRACLRVGEQAGGRAYF